MEEHELNFFPVCYRPDTISYILSWAQLAPEVLTISLSGIGLYRRDFTMIFVIWVTWSGIYGISYGLAQWTKLERPDIYHCSRTYAFPDYTFTPTVGLLINFIFIAITSRIRIFFSTVVWLCIAILIYCFAVVWNYQLYGDQMIFSFGVAVALGSLFGVIYTVFFHPLKYALNQSWVGRICGFQETFN